MYIKNNISYLLAVLLALVSPAFAQTSDLRVCMGARIQYAAEGWEGSKFDYRLEQPHAGIITKTHEDTIVVQWSDTRGIYQLGVRETSRFGCPGDWRFLNIAVVGEHAQFTMPFYNICGDSAVYIEFNKSDFIAWEFVDKSIPENGRITKPGRYEVRTIDHDRCMLSSYIEVIQTQMPRVNLRSDTMVCTPGFTIYALNTQGNPSETVYTWSSDELKPQENIIESGTNIRNILISDHDMNSDTRYYVHAEFNGCYAIDSALVRACAKPQRNINVPNTFTPNDDGDNDVWNIHVLRDYPDCIVEVFDRWGRRVFRSARGYPVPWDGRDLNGRLLPVETYYYIIHVNDDLETHPVNGTITIIY